MRVQKSTRYGLTLLMYTQTLLHTISVNTDNVNSSELCQIKTRL